ncbi:hypothetical protein TIFTF001_032615 [Ficus carica]|uniref:Uncharacterized protein n=1 Tax=Ficus carica TaxID=3494 RepID=A0AA88DXE0_FICCA|nr:hypothetical protein TIFTF001_032615 [Ficus carica]
MTPFTSATGLESNAAAATSPRPTDNVVELTRPQLARNHKAVRPLEISPL